MDSRGEWHLVSRGESMFLDFPARAYRFDIVFYADAFKQKAEVSLQVFQKGRPDKLTEELVRKGVITEEELARQSAQDKRKRAAEEQVSFKSRSLSLLYSLRNSYLHRDIEEEKNLYFAQREAFEGKRGSPAAFESVKRIMEDKERVAVAKLLILQFRYSRDSGIRKAAKEALEASSKKETYLNGLPVASYETAARHSAKFVPQEVFYGPRALQLDSNLGKKIVSFVEAVEKSSFKQSVVYDALAAKVGAKRAEEIIEQIDLSVFSGPNWRSKLETLLLGTPGIVPNE